MRSRGNREGSVPSSGSDLVPAPQIPVENRTRRGGVPTGPRLEQLRKRLGYSVAAVAHDTWITEAALDAYESGMREPPADVIERILHFYGMDPDKFVGSEPAVEESGTLWLGWAELDLSRANTNLDRLIIISQTIRSLRHVREDQPISFRDDELAMMAAQLDLDDPGLVADLQRSFKMDSVAAEETRARLRHAAADVKELPGEDR